MRSSLGVFALASAACFAVACGSSTDSATTAPPPPPTPQPGGGVSLVVGASIPAVPGTAAVVTGAGEFLLVVTDTLTNGSTTPYAFQITVDGTASAGSVSAPASARIPTEIPTDLSPRLDFDYAARLNARASSQLRPLFSAARQRSRSLRSESRSLLAAPQVGDIVTYNVGHAPCDSIVSHPTRIVAIGTKAIIAVDTLNPPTTATAADYARFAANFDTLVYPLDVANFGDPGDVDSNGHIVLLFTRAVNELTPRNSNSYVGGFFFGRDLFPQVATPQLGACRGSNGAEMFYLIAPDPTGAVNGNVRTTGFVDSLTTAILAHEFQHLINASRRIFVNDADDFEDVWLNEGLSHIAEELLFYRQAGLTPRQNITSNTLRTSAATVNAFNADQSSNAGRYREYLLKPSANSPIRDDDSLATRGATWDLLRYAADRKVASAGGSETAVWQALVNAKTNGIPNLRGVFGSNVGAMLRDWSVSHYADDVVSGVGAELTQASWNWHSVFAALGTNGSYPLAITSLPTTGASGSVIPGAAAFYRFAVPANGRGSITLSTGSGSNGAAGVVLRIR